MENSNTYTIHISTTVGGLLSTFPRADYYNAYFFKNIDFTSTYNYPTTTYGGPLTAGILPFTIPDDWDGGVVFNKNISGGPISNFTYEDFSGLLTEAFIGNFFCTPTINLSFSSYDETVSPISKIVYEHKENIYSVSPILTSVITINDRISAFDLIRAVKLITPKQNIIAITPSPAEEYNSTEFIYLSVYRVDSTLNRFKLSYNIFQCGIFDLYKDVQIINSQILDNSSKLLLTLEEKSTKRIYSSVLEVNTPFFLVTGGDTVFLPSIEEELNEVFEIEAGAPESEVIFLAEQIRQKSLPVNPTPRRKINPISPDLAEYYYRGEQGIRIRPLLVKLLPREEFYYERPTSGMIITSGGAPYYPGDGILYNIEYRVI
jgi:hypothetical protein